MRPVLLFVAMLTMAVPVHAADDDTQHILQRGITAFERGDYETARKEFRVLAARDIGSAETLLGTMAANGQGGPREPAVAAAWYLRASRRGHPAAQLALARAFAIGEGVPHSHQRALALAQAAAAQGQPGAAELVSRLMANPAS